MINKPKINLVCGGSYVTGDGWLNLDYSPLSQVVRYSVFKESVSYYYRHFVSRKSFDNIKSTSEQDLALYLKPKGGSIT